MPLLQRGELLQRERVDPPEQGEGPLGRAQPLLLLGPDERQSASGPARPAALLVRGRPATAAPAGPGRTRSTSTSGATPRSSRARCCSASMRSRCSARATSSRCTESVSRSSSPPSSRSRVAQHGQLRSRSAPGLLGRARWPRQPGPASAPGGRGQPARPARPHGRPPPPGPGGPGGPRPGPRSSRSWAAAAGQRVGAPGECPDPLLARCAGRAGRPSRPAGRLRRPARARRGGSCPVRRRPAPLGGGQPLLELGQHRPGPRRAPPAAAAAERSSRSDSPRRTGPARRADRAARRPPPSGVGLVQPVQRRLHVAGGDGLLVQRRRQLRRAAARGGVRPRRAGWPTSSTAACTSSRLGATGRAARGAVAARGCRRRGSLRDSPGCACDQRRAAARSPPRPRRRAARPRAAAARAGRGTRTAPACAPAGRSPAAAASVAAVRLDQQTGPAAVVALEQADRGAAPPARSTRRPRRRPPTERRRDRGLVPVLDGEQRGDGAEHAGEPVAGGRAALPRRPCAPGRARGPPCGRASAARSRSVVALLRPQRGDPLLGRGQAQRPPPRGPRPGPPRRRRARRPGSPAR